MLAVTRAPGRCGRQMVSGVSEARIIRGTSGLRGERNMHGLAFIACGHLLLAHHKRRMGAWEDHEQSGYPSAWSSRRSS